MLTVHRSESSAALATALGEVLSTGLADPFAAEIVAVPAKGIERWLAQSLAGRLGTETGDGVCANVRFPAPAELIGDVRAAADGTARDDDPWRPDALVWHVLSAIDASLDDPACAVLARHLRVEGTDDHRLGRRFATATHLTRLLTSYGEQRPEMIRAWLAGDDADLPSRLRWQPHVLRVVAGRLDVDAPALRLPAACDRLRSDPHAVDLPPRLALFGATRSTTEQRQLLSAVSVHRDVHVFIPHPSDALWRRIADASDGRPPRTSRADEPPVRPRDPVLAGLGRDVVELQEVLAPITDDDRYHRAPGSQVRGALGVLQRAVREDAPAVDALDDVGGTAAPSGTAAASIEFHACHGRVRQVEVLRDLLLTRFAADPTLTPRDVVVMCPDVEEFAPLVRAAFGPGAADHPASRLRVRLADRSLLRTNPVLDVVGHVLSLADGRVTASEVLDLLSADPVRRALRIDDDDLETLHSWVAEGGARWGIGAAQRARFGLGSVPHNTFETALDRLALGAVSAGDDESWLGLALAMDGIESNKVSLAGRFAEFLDRLSALLDELVRPATAQRWAVLLTRVVDELTATSHTDSWQTLGAHRTLAAAFAGAGEDALRLPDVRSMLTPLLSGAPTRSNFRTGELTVCTMTPMRAVPHRIVVLLGLDDEAFPRRATPDGDDVLALRPRVGERDPRSEDRQLLLDAVMSAGDALLVLYTGVDDVTGARRPPSVPVSELIDAVADLTGRPADELLHTHPLQPFDARNFVPEAPLRSFDPHALRAAQARRDVRPAEPFLSAPLPGRDGELTIDGLAEFLADPVKTFVLRRLGVHVAEADATDDVEDGLPIVLDGLARWQIGDRLLAARLAGVDSATFQRAEYRRGTLPPFGLGSDVLDEVSADVDVLADVAGPSFSAEPDPHLLAVPLPDGRELTGAVLLRGGEIVTATFSKLSPKLRIGAWVRVLAAAASGLDGVRAVTVARDREPGVCSRAVVRAPADAAALLADLVAVYDAGMSAPLPYQSDAALAYASARHRGKPPAPALDDASRSWDDRFGGSADRYQRFVAAGADRWAELAAPAPPPEPTQLGTWSVRIWSPLLDHEEVTLR